MNRRITAAVAVAILLTGSCKQPTADDENNTTAKTETMTVKDTDITPTEILQTIQGYYGGSYISNFNRFSRLYNVTMQAGPDKRVAAESLSQVFVCLANGEMAPVTQFARLTTTTGPQSLARFNMFGSISVSFLVPALFIIFQWLQERVMPRKLMMQKR